MIGLLSIVFLSLFFFDHIYSQNIFDYLPLYPVEFLLLMQVSYNPVNNYTNAHPKIVSL